MSQSTQTVDERLEELYNMWMEAVDNDKDVQANQLKISMMKLGATQDDDGVWRINENYSC